MSKLFTGTKRIFTKIQSTCTKPLICMLLPLARSLLLCEEIMNSWFDQVKKGF